MNEINKRKCKQCGEEKERILMGKYPNGRDKKWQQEDGKLWSGNVCGTCNVSRTKNNMHRLRGKLGVS